MISEINSIVFKNVDFYYGKTQIIHDFNLTINKGEKIAFVGKTGAGKTTLINILLGLYDIKNGEILINDIPFQLINKKSYREKISFIDQET
jgi:ABC-type multidrug transport system fused ATPase/permease subunit